MSAEVAIWVWLYSFAIVCTVSGLRLFILDDELCEKARVNIDRTTLRRLLDPFLGGCRTFGANLRTGALEYDGISQDPCSTRERFFAHQAKNPDQFSVLC